jgi:hypothetical protein
MTSATCHGARAHAAVNQVKAADYVGTVLANSLPAGASPLLIAGIAIEMLTIALTIRAARQATR